MRWFLERISAPTLPIYFGISDQGRHRADFAKLVKKKILRHTGNLDAVDCELCEQDHQCQVRESNGRLHYVCEKGGGRKDISSDDVAVWEFDDAAFISLLTDEFSLQDAAGSGDESIYSANTLYRLGIYRGGRHTAEVYYLRNTDGSEPSLRFQELGNSPKILVTNYAKPDLVAGKDNLNILYLSDALASANTRLFDKSAVARCLEGVRRVRFDKKDGHLFLDGKKIYTASIGSAQYHFLYFLWDKWDKQQTHADIHRYITSRTKRDTSDVAQKFCHKTLSAIKSKCKKIDAVISIPTTGRYMMSDPI